MVEEEEEEEEEEERNLLDTASFFSAHQHSPCSTAELRLVRRTRVNEGGRW